MNRITQITVHGSMATKAPVVIVYRNDDSGRKYADLTYSSARRMHIMLNRMQVWHTTFYSDWIAVSYLPQT